MSVNTPAQCQHVRFSGIPCGSPALRGKSFCYYHARVRANRPPLVLPLPDSQRAISFGVAEVLQWLFDKRITPGEARTAIYGLRLASAALKDCEVIPDSRVVLDDPTDEVFREKLSRKVPAEEVVAMVRERAKVG